MNDLAIPLPELSQLVERRLALLRHLAESLESTMPALVRNDAEAIARGAAHQAELCRQWNQLECELRRRTKKRSKAKRTASMAPADSGDSLDASHSAELQAEFDALATRVRYLTRVHWSLLRHLERSLAVLHRVVDSCATTYAPPPAMIGQEIRIRGGE
ncbi:MAG: flagellar export chaperone FlgN [Terriglobales bacterium]